MQLNLSLQSIVSAFILLILTGCGGGGGSDNTGGTPPPTTVVTNNLASKGLQIITLEPRIGYPINVLVSIEAETSTQNVSLSFFAVDDTSDPLSSITDARQLPLGSRVIPLVSAGTQSYEFDIDIPSSITSSGSYYIATIIDPANFIEESNEGDNGSTVETTLLSAEFPLLPIGNKPVNVFIDELTPDRSVILLDNDVDDVIGDSIQNADAGATIYLGAQGAESAVELEVFAALRFTRSDTVTSYEVPLYLWNSVSGRYMNAYGVDPIKADSIPGIVEWLPVGSIDPQLSTESSTHVTFKEIDRRSVHLDLYFPGRLAKELEIILRSIFVSFSTPPPPPPDLSAEAIAELKSFFRGSQMSDLESCLLVKVRPTNTIFSDRFAEDNEICSPITFELAPAFQNPPTYPIEIPPEKNYGSATFPTLFNESYADSWGGQSFGFGLNFSAFSSADFRGLITEAHGSIPVNIFGGSFNFLQVDGRVQVLPSYNGAPDSSEQPGFTLDLYFLEELAFFVDLQAGSFTDQISFTKETGKSATIMVGPIPLTVQGTVMGQIGVDYSVGFGTALNLSATPFATLQALASATVGIPGFGFGPEGSLILLDERFEVTTAASLSVIDDGFTSGTAEILLLPTLKAVNDITGANGTLSFFVEYPVPSITWCGDWIPYICGLFSTAKSSHVLESYRGFGKRDTLIDEQMLITVVKIEGEDPAYYE